MAEDLEEFEEKVNKVEDKVKYVLSKFEKARDDDRLLNFLVNWIFNRDAMISLGKLIYWLSKNDVKIPDSEQVEIITKTVSKLISQETTARCRRKIQNSFRMYLPSPDAVERREKFERFWRKLFP